MLEITDFNATPVPGPLPVLGAAATFGWIRRRRALLAARRVLPPVHSVGTSLQ